MDEGLRAVLAEHGFRSVPARVVRHGSVGATEAAQHAQRSV